MSEFPESTPQPERLIELIVEAMPVFEGKIDAEQATIRVRGPIWLGATAILDAVYAAPDERYVEQFAAHLVERTRTAAIRGLGLEAAIEERVHRARMEERIAAFADGKAAGIAEGRRAMLAEILAARTPEEAGR